MENKLLEKEDFFNKLNCLNYGLKNILEKNNFSPTIIGNLFYDHEQPCFYESKLLDDCREKRLRFAKAASMSKTMFEIGLNGGHSAFLALMSNKKLKVYSNDIADFYPTCPNVHPEIYVPEAATILKDMFGDRFSFIKGSCLTEVPKFVKDNNDIKIDLVHIDGEKTTYKTDFFNILPLLAENAIVIFDDTNMDFVNYLCDNLVDHYYLHRSPDFPTMNEDIKYRNEILIYKKKTNKIVFETIYKKQIWNNNDPNVPLSGPGSSLENANGCSKMLNYFIYQNKCDSILDLGCGDLTWISKTPFFNDTKIKYTGVDVVQSLIDSHSLIYKEKKFLCKDIAEYKELDFNSLIIIRDVIFHLTTEDILKIFDNIKGKFKFIAITSCRNMFNSDEFGFTNCSNYLEKNINIEPFNISLNFIESLYERNFNRDFYIYKHTDFYLKK